MSRDMVAMNLAGIPVEVIRKRIKHLYIRVDPDSGRVRVSVPWRMPEAAVRSAVAARLEWIHRQQLRRAQRVDDSRHAYIDGEAHDLWGRSHRLRVVEKRGRSRASIDEDGALELFVEPGSDASRRRDTLNNWYREQLRAEIPGLVRAWEPVMGVTVAEWRIKRMKTRWGTCNARARRIWLNLELVKKPPACLEYVVVHEMVHLLERGHNKRFHGFMDQFLPDWRAHRETLNATGIL